MEAMLVSSIERQPVLVLGGAGEWPRCTDLIQQRLSIHPADTVVVPGTATIDQVRTVLQRIQLKPVYGARTLVCFHDVDRWSTELATTLLKTIEEPPAFAAVCLFATTGSEVLRTIRSRVITVRYRSNAPIASATTSAALKDEFARIATLVEDDESIEAPLAAWIAGASSPQVARRLLQLRTTVGTAPVNRKLVLEAAVLAQRLEAVL